MDHEVAASRYVLTIVVYLTAVTIYAVGGVSAEDRSSQPGIFTDIS
jgi:hypothetical protein